jgi:hypothetical protein
MHGLWHFVSHLKFFQQKKQQLAKKLAMYYKYSALQQEIKTHLKSISDLLGT